MNATASQPTPTATHTMALLLSSTRRGARLARLLTVDQLRIWPVSPDVADRAEQIVAELTANAVLHARVSGRDFRLALTLSPVPGVLRIGVTDARGDQLPQFHAHLSTEGGSGRGLFLVTTLADRWGTTPYPPSGKTIWAEIHENETQGRRAPAPNWGSTK